MRLSASLQINGEFKRIEHLGFMTALLSRFYRELLSRLKHIEMSAEPSWIHAIFVGGLKSMPVKYEFK